MTYDIIQQFVELDKRKEKKVMIHFKGRNAIKGIFIFSRDYDELKKKNFWRVVPESRYDQWQSTKDASLSRLFNGAEFTRLTDK